MENNFTSCGERPDRRHLIGLVVVLIVCATLYGWLVGHTEAISRDGVTYVKMARQWSGDSSGVIKRLNYHVGYPVAMVGMRKLMMVFGASDAPANWDLAGQLVSLLAGLAAVSAIWLFAGFLFNWQVAFVTALLFGIGRSWACMGADVLSDSLAVCFQMWAVVWAVLAARALRRSRKSMAAYAVLVGLCAGVGYLVRPGSLVMVVLPAIIWLACQLRWRRSWRLTFASIAAMVASAAVCSLPYMIAIGGISKKKSLFDLLRELVESGGSSSAVLATVISSQYSGLRELLNELFAALHPVLGFALCIWLITWVCSKVFRMRLPKPILLFPNHIGAWFVFGVVAVTVPLLLCLYRYAGYISYRHAAFMAAMISPFAGAGIVIVARWAEILSAKLGVNTRYLRLIFFTVIMAFAIGMLTHSFRPLHEGKGCLRRAGIFVGKLAVGRERILSDSLRVVHYAGSANSMAIVRLTPRTVTNKETLAREIERISARYFVFTGKIFGQNENEIYNLPKRLMFTEIRRFQSTNNGERLTIIIYKVNRTK